MTRGKEGAPEGTPLHLGTPLRRDRLPQGLRPFAMTFLGRAHLKERPYNGIDCRVACGLLATTVTLNDLLITFLNSISPIYSLFDFCFGLGTNRVSNIGQFGIVKWINPGTMHDNSQRGKYAK